MQFLRHKARELIIFMVILTPTILIYTLLVYTNQATNEPIKFRITTFVLGLVLFLLLGFFSGNTEQKKGWIAGLSSAIIVISIVLLLQLMSKSPLLFEHLLKYGAYLASSIVGGILGVNFKRIL